MTTSDDRIDEYFRRYAATLSGFDAEAAAGLWSTPGMIVDDRASGVLDSRDGMITGLQQSYPVYRRLGLAAVGHEVLGAQHLTGVLALVHVRFRFFDADGGQLTDTTSHYLLRDGEEGLRAVVCVETDAAENLAALARERGVDLAPGA